MDKNVKTKNLDYHGTPLALNDARILQELEEQISEAIPFVRIIGSQLLGFSSSNNRVTGIGLYNKGLNKLPSDIGDLDCLKILVLEKNNLTSLPDSIDKLTNLTDLILTNNKLTYVSDNIGNLKQLQYLYLNANQLTALPGSIEKLVNLLEFNFRGNKIVNLPSSQLENLKKQGCRISK
ncbi:MAG: leucine-rich repeat domain-containing protein [Candidatus Hodarchaeales archaeon]|jgi:Leucine-rich repeat (LRR) protein